MLGKCPECGHDVSDKAAACPNCGWQVVPSELVEKTKETSKDTSEKEDSDYETVKIMIDNRNWGIAPSCSFYINGIEVWRGRIGDTAELKLKGKTKVRFKSFGIPLVILYGEFEGEIDPAAGKKYVLKYKGKNKHKIQFALRPAEFF